ncbi:MULTISPECIES: DUF1971 domain-containing protein [Shewanella]|uniref:DUF1971 domain-containing protein n=1 Tax=Shewanella sedimentimangrovi TaxID=2814293 RepID=A0ABX7R549_9GAMM|nr:MULTISPECIES: DUF1971 domain-containing protein [Shewanella]QSX37925.1 DUF1971 domain-containing protein [Shewanella sedimentimangrovi]QSX41489.1 DUF1971 domain-containing protein [Shewanella cyperi]
MIPKACIKLGTTTTFDSRKAPQQLLQPHIPKAGFHCRLELLSGELDYLSLRADGQPLQLRLKANERVLLHSGHSYCLKPLAETAQFRFSVFATPGQGSPGEQSLSQFLAPGSDS